MSNEIQLCVRGWVGSDPALHVGPNGGRLARFRVGVTPRVRDRDTGEFRDGVTQWFTVKAWRDLAENACHSLRKGTPVVVRGILSTESWSVDGEERSSSVITADSIGVDLGTGTASFARTIRRSAAADTGGPGAVEREGVGTGTITSGDDDRWSVAAELPPDDADDAEDAEEETDDLPEGPGYTLVGSVGASVPTDG